MRTFYIGFLAGIAAIFAALGSLAQNAPVTTAATIGGATPGTINVAITVTNFNNIGAISLSLDYDHSVLNFISFTPNSQLITFAVGDNDLETGYHRVVMGWFGNGTTLPDGSTIMTLSFTYISGITSLAWYDMGPSCEYADANYNVLNDIPQEDYYIDGYVCGAIATPGPVTGSNSVCPGDQNIMYSVDAVANATGYNWTVPIGADIVNGANTNLISVNYSPTAISGYVTVTPTNQCGSGQTSQLAVTVHSLPVANAGPDLSIPYGTSTTLTAASGGSGSYSYHWSPEELLVDPDVQNPQTVVLTSSTLFTVLVTDLTAGCPNSDNVMVTLTGGPLNANPLAVPGILCLGESAQLYANASGGSGNYTYLWTSNPPGSPAWTSTLANPVVTPDVTTQYLVQINDGFTTSSGATNLSVFELPTATISGGDTLCGSSAMTTLQVDLTGTPPWSFTYSYGSTSMFVSGQWSTPYEIITGDAGDYTITAIQDAHCEGTAYGTAIVRKYPFPDKPEITQYLMELISSSCCGNQWYLNYQPIEGATGQTYQLQVSGLYYVIVTLNGCSSEPSDTLDIIVGLPEQQEGPVAIYPNPAKDRVNVQFPDPVKGKASIDLYSTLGKAVRHYDLDNPGQKLTLDVSDLPPGVYFLSFNLNQQFVTVNLMINK